MRADRLNTAEQEKATGSGKKRTGFHGNLSSGKKRVIAIVVAVLLLFGATYGRSIMRLKAENRALKKQQEELLSEKNAKTKELKNVHSKEYIEEQARKQLRLLNKDEILFIFDDEKDKNGGD